MATRILFDPRVDLPDGTSASSPVIIEATPTAIRASGAVVTFPTTLGFTVNTSADAVQLATPGAGQAWRLVVRRPGGTRIGSLYASPGAILLDRTVTWTDAPTITWAALTDVDPATLTPTPSVVASWAATAALAQSALDAVIALKAGAPGALDTFLELATQLQADESGAAALATLVAGKADAASVAATYVTYDGTNLRKAGTVIPITGGGGGGSITVVDNADGTLTISPSAGVSLTDNGDGSLTLVA